MLSYHITRSALSSVRSCGIHLRPRTESLFKISATKKMFQNYTYKITVSSHCGLVAQYGFIKYGNHALHIHFEIRVLSVSLSMGLIWVWKWSIQDYSRIYQGQWVNASSFCYFQWLPTSPVFSCSWYQWHDLPFIRQEESSDGAV